MATTITQDTVNEATGTAFGDSPPVVVSTMDLITISIVPCRVFLPFIVKTE